MAFAQCTLSMTQDYRFLNGGVRSSGVSVVTGLKPGGSVTVASRGQPQFPVARCCTHNGLSTENIKLKRKGIYNLQLLFRPRLIGRIQLPSHYHHPQNEADGRGVLIPSPPNTQTSSRFASFLAVYIGTRVLSGAFEARWAGSRALGTWPPQRTQSQRR